MRTKIGSCVASIIASVVLFTPVAQAGHAGGGSPGGNVQIVPLVCRAIDGTALNESATVFDGYGTSQVRIGAGKLLCTIAATLLATSVTSNLSGDNINAFKCYTLATNAQQGTPEPDSAFVTDNFNVSGVDSTFGITDDPVSVTSERYLCVPAIVSSPNP